MNRLSDFAELKRFLQSKSGLQMSHIYKPAMLLTVIRNGGEATKERIAKEFVLRDTDQVDFYRKRIVHNMPGRRLVRDGLLDYQGDSYRLSSVFEGLSGDQLTEAEGILEKRITDFMQIRNPFGLSNADAVRGSVRYEVLRRAKGRCEACGASTREAQIDEDHTVPRSKGGSNEIQNLQALCRTCNSQKLNRDDTDFRVIQDSYSHRESDCVFCELDGRAVIENELAVVIEDAFPVSEGHSLVIPKRHVADYFDLHVAESRAIKDLLQQRKDLLLKADPTIDGFNVGVNVGESAGQTVFHVHVHLIPRMTGDHEKPRGGVRKVIAAMADYWTSFLAELATHFSQNSRYEARVFSTNGLRCSTSSSGESPSNDNPRSVARSKYLLSAVLQKVHAATIKLGLSRSGWPLGKRCSQENANQESKEAAPSRPQYRHLKSSRFIVSKA